MRNEITMMRIIINGVCYVVRHGGAGDAGELPAHGTLGRVRQQVPDDRRAGVVPPEQVEGAPSWMASMAGAPPGDAAGEEE